MIRILKYRKAVALFLLFNMVGYILEPTTVWALTSGPAQPEFSSFEPVATTNMVNEFTGDFTYNLPVIEVPGPHGSGYAMSLSYHSGTSPEEESSWVGYGWTLNPGAINRNTRGFPDDYNGKEVRYHNKKPNNWTVTVGAKAGPETFSLDIPVSGQSSLRYNNYMGFGYNAGVGLSLGKGIVNLGFNVSNGDASFSLNISPLNVLNYSKKGNSSYGLHHAANIDKTHNQQSLNNQKISRHLSTINSIASSYISSSFNEPVRNSIMSDYTGGSVNGTLGVNITPTFLEAGLSVDIFGNVAVQEYKEEKDVNTFGFMYSHYADEESVMDYHIEKETPVQKRDVFIGIPHNNADYFMATGEGMSGGFRLHHKQVGHFRPNRTVSETGILNVGGEIEVGFNWGGGVDVGLGFSAITSRGWTDGASQFSSAEDQKDVFFKFSNDPAGSWLHSTQEEPIWAGISGGGAPGVKSFNPSLPSGVETMNEGLTAERSSYIAYRTNAQIDASRAESNPYQRYSLRDDTFDAANEARSTESDHLDDGIGEIAIFNESGSRYVYGLPVYSRKEKNLQYGLQNAPASLVDNNFLVHYKDNKTKLGEERDGAYATAYLLTEITTPDFVDRTFDGPTRDDMGGYTRFNYARHAGGNSSDWYQWRLPYTGLSYNRNSMSDPKDDLGSYSEGQKELYYLQSVETKTHAAIFITSNRNDGTEAAGDAITNPNAKGTTSLKKLDRIEVYALGDTKTIDGNIYAKEGALPLKTVHFDYDYSLINNTPNSTSGRLTLKKLWFEYDGIAEARISPYRFDYAYTQATYPAKYQSIATELGQYTIAQQNPDYNPLNIDPWGNYQPDGASRYAEMRSWVDQKANPAFDPAAWQLKTITLPSGGEIHVQYEQDDYSYVQDQEAHAMVRLHNSSIPALNKYYLNTEADLDLDATELDIMARLMRERYLRDKNKLYFKFLYKLMGDGSPDISSCNSEYITGYVDITDVGVEGGRLFIQLASDEKRVPGKVCKDFVMTQRLGNLNASGNCDASSVGIDPNNDVVGVIKQLGNMAKSIVVPGILCQEINTDISYFRVPLPVSKKGGGVRVKRLLTYDRGLENNPVLYGNEYRYEFEDPLTQTVRSSGVATNEPAAIREENILVDYIAREKQDWLDRIIAGIDKAQSEGALGETIMPGASIGYAQVVVKNIHSGKTGTGFNVKQFHTARDSPFQAFKTEIEDRKDYVPFPFGLVNVFVNNLWMTQGFVFKMNNMHGQFKKEANYTGEYTPDLASATAITEQEYKYFQPDEAIPVTSDLSLGVTYENPGKEIDITFADKAIIEEQYDANVEVDISVGIIPFIIPIFIPQANAAPSLNHTRMELYKQVTTKVIKYPVFVKEVITRKDGVEHRQENLAFDKYTGKPVSVRSYDEFVGSYLSQSIPASWKYDNFEPMANEEGRVIQAAMAYGTSGPEERIYFTDGESCQLLAEFTKGDLLELGEGAFYHVKGFDFLTDEVIITPSEISTSAPPASFTSVTILRSGNNNRLNDQAGQTVFHSTSPNINLPDANDDTRWVSNAFTTDLNTAMASQTEFTLAGPYSNMNMSGYLGAVPSGCTINLREARIRNASFVHFERNGSLDLYLLSFEIDCGGSWETIDAEAL
ncbi:MAG: hypothetical protein AAF519_00585 [Bacteroidota bacterium]